MSSDLVEQPAAHSDPVDRRRLAAAAPVKPVVVAVIPAAPAATIPPPCCYAPTTTGPAAHLDDPGVVLAEIDEDRMKGTRRHLLCDCRHSRDAHRHYRPGRDCALCECPRWSQWNPVTRLSRRWARWE